MNEINQLAQRRMIHQSQQASGVQCAWCACRAAVLAHLLIRLLFCVITRRRPIQQIQPLFLWNHPSLSQRMHTSVGTGTCDGTAAAHFVWVFTYLHGQPSPHTLVLPEAGSQSVLHAKSKEIKDKI